MAASVKEGKEKRGMVLSISLNYKKAEGFCAQVCAIVCEEKREEKKKKSSSLLSSWTAKGRRGMIGSVYDCW